jgi:hypothetical protein
VEVIGEVHLNAWHTPNHTHIANAGQAVVAPGRAPGRPSALLRLSSCRYSQGYSQLVELVFLQPHTLGKRDPMRIPVHLRQRVHGCPPRTVEIALNRAVVQGRRWTFVDVRGAFFSG